MVELIWKDLGALTITCIGAHVYKKKTQSFLLHEHSSAQVVQQ